MEAKFEQYKANKDNRAKLELNHFKRNKRKMRGFIKINPNVQ